MSDEMRELERASIREFVQSQSHLFTDRLVLDLGCGSQPYRGIVEEAEPTAYVAYDSPILGGSVVDEEIGGNPYTIPRRWDVILCTQVIQYVPHTKEWLEGVWDTIAYGGRLVMTGPTNWPVVESDDLYRFTPDGIAFALGRAGFKKIRVSPRASWQGFLLGWGAVACR